MSHQQQGQGAPDSNGSRASHPPVITDRYRSAVKDLGGAYLNRRPLVVVVGDGKSGAAFVVNKFLAGIRGTVSVARITEHDSEPLDMMRGLMEAIGVDPKTLSLSELEQVFDMFLAFQKSHNRRTIICIEECQDIGRWLLDRVCHMVSLEEKGKFGLTVVLSGWPGLQDMLGKAPLNAISAQSSERITLAPFTLPETKEYIRRRVKVARPSDTNQVFTSNAITAIQKLSKGIPDEVSNLCSKCLELLEMEDTGQVTSALVKRSARLLRLAFVVQEPNAVIGKVAAAEEKASKPRLVAHLKDSSVQEKVLDGGHVLIGRAELCDICLSNSMVSRHHALIVHSSIGIKIVDLGSKNGTYVNGKKITKHTLQHNDKITVGDCGIRYVAGDQSQSWYFDTDPTDILEPRLAPRETASPGNGVKAKPIDRNGTMMSLRQLGARN
jgi:type II secretory pathway predicted ATPase ExeA